MFIADITIFRIVLNHKPNNPKSNTMKTINYLLLLIVAICAAITGGCSSGDEPNLAFDDNSFADIIEGRTSAVMTLKWDGAIYYKNDAGEWKANYYDGIRGIGGEIIIENGVSYTELRNAINRSDSFFGISNRIFAIWNTYCELTNCETRIMSPIVFALDINGGKIQYGDVQLDIISVDGNDMSALEYGTNSLSQKEYQKHYTLTVEPLKKSYKKTLEFHASAKDAKLALVRKLRSYFGDYFDISIYWKPLYGELNEEESWLNSKINLKLLEEDILNDRVDTDSGDRYGIPNT